MSPEGAIKRDAMAQGVFSAMQASYLIPYDIPIDHVRAVSRKDMLINA